MGAALPVHPQRRPDTVLWFVVEAIRHLRGIRHLGEAGHVGGWSVEAREDEFEIVPRDHPVRKDLVDLDIPRVGPCVKGAFVSLRLVKLDRLRREVKCGVS